ncbi:MAG: (2Fe-2S)-binding protein [Erythrobacter sp.]
MSITFTLNGKPMSYDGDPEMPLLWFMREELGLYGAKFGCGLPTCGACLVHLDGEPSPTCRLEMRAIDGSTIRTIEGLADGGALHPVQQAWIDEDVSQCGYCQAGQIMSAVALLERNPDPDDAAIDEAMFNLCRCGTYPRIRKAIRLAASRMAGEAA